MGPDELGHPGRRDQPLGPRALRHAEVDPARERRRAVRLRQVARPDLRARGGSPRPDPRRRRRDPDAALARAVLHLGSDLRVHALLRRQRRARADPGDADGVGDGGDLDDAAAARLPERPGPVGRGGAETGCDGAVAADDRRGAVQPRRSRPGRARPVRRRGAAALSGTDVRGDPLEVVATVLLALATVATAWSGYQASRWNGEQAKAFSRGNAARIESTRASSRADAQTQIDVATFTAWADAYARKETLLADFYFARFRAEFKPAVDAWIATRPLRNAEAP